MLQLENSLHRGEATNPDGGGSLIPSGRTLALNNPSGSVAVSCAEIKEKNIFTAQFHLMANEAYALWV